VGSYSGAIDHNIGMTAQYVSDEGIRGHARITVLAQQNRVTMPLEVPDHEMAQHPSVPCDEE
jgi:hypothetical protein